VASRTCLNGGFMDRSSLNAGDSRERSSLDWLKETQSAHYLIDEVAGIASGFVIAIAIA
jgi:hypothetical protein